MKVYAPKHLKVAGKEFYRKIAGQYPLTAAEVEVLIMACECLDEIADAQDIIASQGITYKDRFGEDRPRLQLKIIKDSRIVFNRMVKTLNLASTIDEVKDMLKAEKPAEKSWKERYPSY